MKKLGLTIEILFNTILIVALAMFLIGIIAFKVSEKYAIEGKVDSVKSIINAFENSYLKSNNIEGGIDFLKNSFNKGTWGAIAIDDKRYSFETGTQGDKVNRQDPMILSVLISNNNLLEIEGINLPPFSFYEGLKYAEPLIVDGKKYGAIVVYQPLSDLKDEFILAQRLIAVWGILFLLVIGLFGFYLITRRVVKPIHKLIRTTDEIAAGEFPKHVQLGGAKEIDQLYDALGNMYYDIEENKKNLQDNIVALEKANQELKKTQKELIESEKLASLGKLSAGIAHEIGNPLSSIEGYIELLKRDDITNDEQKKEFFNKILRETQRIDKIIRTLLDYVRPRDYMSQKINPNDVIKSSMKIIKSQGILKNIEMKQELCNSLPTVNADPHQLSQVIINLILNSKDALGNDGQITITTKINSNYSEILLHDNGSGIPEEIKSKIFDPFFTTKEPGKGTGLGLSICKRIVENFEGTIEFESKSGIGTTFIISLPNSN